MAGADAWRTGSPAAALAATAQGAVTMSAAVSCRACGALIDESLDTAGAQAPCRECGSTARAFAESLTEGVMAGDHLKRHIKRRRGGKSKPYKEEIDSDDLQRSTGRWLSLTRTIDRANDQYSEKVVDPRTGEVVHECEEPLSAHRGHGSAKRR